MHSSELVKDNMVPEFMRQPGIKQGYRKPSENMWQILSSLVNVHNETGNIWTHLLSGSLFLLLVPYTYYALSDYKTQDIVYMLVFVLAASFCFFGSALYHLFICTRRGHYMWRHIDHSGIISMVCASYLPALNRGFICFPWYQQLYIGMAIACWVAIIIVVPALDKRERRTQRNIVLFISATWGIVPLIHYCLYGRHGWKMFLTRTIVMWLVYGIGFLFYVTKWPEIRYTGKFDIWGHSHQWWHLCTIFASFFWWYTLMKMHRELPSHCE